MHFSCFNRYFRTLFALYVPGSRFFETRRFERAKCAKGCVDAPFVLFSRSSYFFY